MAITVQQFDLIAAVNGLGAALAAAEAAGGVSGSRTAPTSVSPTGSPTGQRSLTPGPLPGATSTPTSQFLAQAAIPQSLTTQQQPTSQSGTPSKAPGPSSGPTSSGLTPELIERDFKDGIIPFETAIDALNDIGVLNPGMVVTMWSKGGTGIVLDPTLVGGPVPLKDGTTGTKTGTTTGTKVGTTDVSGSPGLLGSGGNNVSYPSIDVSGSPGLLGSGGINVSSPDIANLAAAQAEEARRFAVGEQRGDPLQRRVFGETFPGFRGTYLGNNYLPRLQDQFERTIPITSFGSGTPGFASPNDEATAFRNFLQSRPTGAGLGSQLANILSGVQGGNIDPDVFQGSFTNPEARSAFGTIAPAFQAATAPLMASTGPRFQGSIAKVLEQRLLDAMADNPEAFGTPQSIFNRYKQFIPGFEGFN